MELGEVLWSNPNPKRGKGTLVCQESFRLPVSKDNLEERVVLEIDGGGHLFEMMLYDLIGWKFDASYKGAEYSTGLYSAGDQDCTPLVEQRVDILKGLKGIAANTDWSPPRGLFDALSDESLKIEVAAVEMLKI